MKNDTNWALMPASEKAGAIAMAAMKSGKDGEIALASLADAQGDEAALEVMSNLSPHVLVRIVKEFDYSCPSVTGMITTPEHVVKILSADPANWADVLNMGDEEITKTLEDIKALVISLVLCHDSDEWRQKTLEAIAKNETAMLYLTISFIGRFKCKATSKDEEIDISDIENLFLNHEVEEGEIWHLFEEVKRLTPKIGEKIIQIAMDAISKHEGLLRLQEIAKQDSVKTTKKADDMFVPL